MRDDPEIERLMAMSGEEILAEARAEGIDTDKLAREMAQQFQVIARLVRERDEARQMFQRTWLRVVQKNAKIRQLREALVTYGGCLPGCDLLTPHGSICTCGWGATRRALEARDA